MVLPFFIHLAEHNHGAYREYTLRDFFELNKKIPDHFSRPLKEKSVILERQ